MSKTVSATSFLALGCVGALAFASTAHAQEEATYPNRAIRIVVPLAAAGAGLGLSIVDRLVRLLDVRLDVSSEVGKGSSFALELPAVDHNGGEITQWTDALIDRADDVEQALTKEKIGSRRFWLPIHRQDSYKQADAGFEASKVRFIGELTYFESSPGVRRGGDPQRGRRRARRAPRASRYGCRRRPASYRAA